MIIRIVVGSDGSAEGQNAVLFAAELARQLHAEVLLAHAAGDGDLAVLAAAESASPSGADGDGEEADSLENRVRTAWAKPLIDAGVSWGAEVRFGSTAHVLAQIADEVGAQLLVVGATSPDGEQGPALRDVSGVLAHPRAVPVVVVPHSNGLAGPFR